MDTSDLGPFRCITPDALEAWRALNERLPVTAQAASICVDCTVAYRRQMVAQGRCALALGYDVSERRNAPVAREERATTRARARVYATQRRGGAR